MSEPIKVLHVFAALDAGGVENFVMNVFRRIDRSEIQFDFAMTAGRVGVFDDEVRSLGGRLYYFDTSRRIEQNLRDLLNREHYDVVHSHIYFYSGLVLREAKHAGVPIRIAHAHNAYTGEGKNLKRKAYEALMRHMIQKYSTVMLGCSKKVNDYVFRNHPEAIFFPDGIECNRYEFKETDRSEIRKQYGLENRFVVGHVGCFAPAKNHEKVLTVFAALLKKRPDAALLLVGDGELETEVRTKAETLGIKDHVVFAGVHADVERYYSAMDVFFFPSRFEGFGMVMIEAQANGLPCVASTEVPEETKMTECVRFLPLEDTDENYAEAILSVGTRGNSSEMLQAVKSLYDIETATAHLRSIYLGKETIKRIN